jgi:CRISPR system Cascade subunit CasD
MQAVLITLKGPMASWGAPSIGDNRESYSYPTASAIIGLLGACMGINRHDPEGLDALFAAWDVATFTLSSWRHEKLSENQLVQPALSHEFQTAMDSLMLNGELNTNPVLGYKAFYQDMYSSAALILRDGQNQRWLEWAEYGLKQPVYTPCLGRISHPLSEPLAPELFNFSDNQTLEKLLMEKTVTKAMQAWEGSYIYPAYLETEPVGKIEMVYLTDRRNGWRKYYSQQEYWLKEVRA